MRGEKMNDMLRDKAILEQKCDEKEMEITFDEIGRMIAIKGYCKAKDFKKVKK